MLNRRIKLRLNFFGCFHFCVPSFLIERICHPAPTTVTGYVKEKAQNIFIAAIKRRRFPTCQLHALNYHHPSTHKQRRASPAAPESLRTFRAEDLEILVEFEDNYHRLSLCPA
jgi:hypothetical protein